MQILQIMRALMVSQKARENNWQDRDQNFEFRISTLYATINIGFIQSSSAQWNPVLQLFHRGLLDKKKIPSVLSVPLW